jgi:hypothetical protein
MSPWEIPFVFLLWRFSAPLNCGSPLFLQPCHLLLPNYHASSNSSTDLIPCRPSWPYPLPPCSFPLPFCSVPAAGQGRSCPGRQRVSQLQAPGGATHAGGRRSVACGRWCGARLGRCAAPGRRRQAAARLASGPRAGGTGKPAWQLGVRTTGAALLL